MCSSAGDIYTQKCFKVIQPIVLEKLSVIYTVEKHWEYQYRKKNKSFEFREYRNTEYQGCRLQHYRLDCAGNSFTVVTRAECIAHMRCKVVGNPQWKHLQFILQIQETFLCLLQPRVTAEVWISCVTSLSTAITPGTQQVLASDSSCLMEMQDQVSFFVLLKETQ